VSKPTFWVLHDYGTEGWHIQGKGDYDSILDAVEAREADLSNGGGKSVIVEVINTLDAYRRADYERQAREWEANQK
jgi:hypothetical protein